MLVLLLACTDAPTPDSEPPVQETAADTTDSQPPDLSVFPVTVTVLLDGVAAPDVTLGQGGLPRRWVTDADGQAVVDVDPSVEGDVMVVASHHDARIVGYDVRVGDTELTMELTRFDTSDNEAYVFRDPGTPETSRTTGQCGHCHRTINESWYDSPHATSASNPAVQAAYALVQAETTGTGQCADCHAPGIDGTLGGRGLHEAEGWALDHGVHCDTCHRVESVDLSSHEPGVAGRLNLLRPSEEGTIGFDWTPLVFGPYDDVATVIMGAVQRDHFVDGELCAGCHEHTQASLVDTPIDTARWPDGRIPVHSTWSEWSQGPLADAAPCQACHMPPAYDVGNAGDLGNLLDLTPGVVGGWYRSPGTVRQHSWVGPRAPESGMLQLAAALDVEASVDQDTLSVRVTTSNVGPGHAIPTGEPARNLILRVRATCDGTELPATGGATVPDWGGALDTRTADWSTWPGAEVGQRIAVVEHVGWVDYDGPVDFAADGRFTPEQRGLPDARTVGVATIVAVSGDTVTLDQALPPGDVAYRIAGDWPVHDAGADSLAGLPGFGWARVLVDADGVRMAPHHRAIDVASDNRIGPAQHAVTEHTFETTCDDPLVEAVLIHRAYAPDAAAELGVSLTDSVMQSTQVSP